MKPAPRRCYHTTPIYYVNGIPHVGHAYTTIAADALTRARRLAGHEVFFLTGTDEHGQNIERIARERGISEQQHCDEIAAQFRSLWSRLGIVNDDFIRTTEERHRRGVLALWARLSKAKAPNGEPSVYRAKYSGWYCPRCEGFKDEGELGQPGNVCPDHELPCEWTEEENLFFRLSSYSEWLRGEIESNRLLIEPPGRRNEILSVIDQGLRDFSVSRARVRWGIPVPEQPDHVLYVWVDALSNYITALGLADESGPYVPFWKQGGERLHLVGKDIIRFHCLYWPAILKAAGLEIPTRVFVQGHITKNGRKLSKTTGNVIDPEALLAEWGADAVRYYLLREGVFGHDWDFTDRSFVTRYNADLANDLGNLVSRSLTMAARFCDGRVPPRPTSVGPGSEFEARMQREAAALTGRVIERYEALDLSGALSLVWSWISELNQRIVVMAPWEMAKHPERRADLDAFLYRLLEAIRMVAVLVSPVMPASSARIREMLGDDGGAPGPDHLAWGRLEGGALLGRITPLFPRVDRAKPLDSKENTVPETPAKSSSSEPPASSSLLAAPAGAAPAPAGAEPGAPSAAIERIGIADFARVELRVARIVEAEKVKGSKKLIRLQVDLGSERRQVVAGIAQWYEPEMLVGKSVALVANLEPAKLMGVESNGMVLAASPEGRALLCTFDGDVAPGTRIR